MTGGLAPGPDARCLVADAGARGGDCGGRAPRVPLPAVPLRIPARASYAKSDVFDLCDALARAERVLIEAGRREEAVRVAVAFDVLEAGLVRRTARAQSPAGSNSIASEFTQ